jgi:hypothetical protein
MIYREIEQSNTTPKAEFWIVNLKLGVSGFVTKDFLSHGISIPIWPSNKVTILYAKFNKKLVNMLCQNCQIDQSATTVAD